VDFALKLLCYGTDYLVNFRFNPCFGGFCFKTHLQREYQTSQHTVSILVLVDFALKLMHPVVSLVLDTVSILVLVDFALKLSTGSKFSFQFICFNPCFGGFCFKTQVLSPLPSVYSLFQSLFWWILLLNCCFIGLRKRIILSFNPCFDGFCS